MKTRMDVILPKSLAFEPKRLAPVIENTLDGAALGAKADFDATHRTWKHSVTFYITPYPGMREIWTGDLIYKFISGGTRVRHALMSSNFSPKSRHRALRSNKGRGGVVIVSRKIIRPGIKAREFDLAVKQKWDKELPQLLQRAIDEAVRTNGA